MFSERGGRWRDSWGTKCILVAALSHLSRLLSSSLVSQGFSTLLCIRITWRGCETHDLEILVQQVQVGDCVSVHWVSVLPCGTFLMVQWLRIHLPMQGTQVRSLVGELRSHMLWSLCTLEQLNATSKPLCCN